MTKISICIPTYNRARCLVELLDSIVAQGLPDDIEVVVSDDASPDNSVEEARRFAERIPHFQLLTRDANIGLDANFLAVVAAARSPYIWLMGDDDRLEPDGARRVLEALARWPDVVGLTLGVIDYDPTMTKRIGVRKVPPTKEVRGAAVVFSEIAELLGFMSALVVKRDLWNEQANEPSVRAIKNYYVQVLILGRVIGTDGQWGIVQDPCVGFRTGNDQFKAKFGWIDRLKIDVNAYDEIGALLFPNDTTTRRAMRKRIFRTHVMARIANAKTETPSQAGTFTAARFLIKRYGNLDLLWTRGLPLLLTPSWVIRILRDLYKRYSPSSGTNRAKAS